MNVERPILGVTKPERRRRLLPTDPNQEILRAVRLKPLLLKVLVESEETYQEARKAGREKQEALAKEIWGEGLPRRISPSTAAKCLRWIGYEMREEKPVKKTPEQILAMMWGSSGHYSILRVLRPFGAIEFYFIMDEEEMSGKLDFLLRNPLFKEKTYQIMELKTTSSWGFRQVKRKGIPPWMTKERDLYHPRPEDRIQLLLYIWAKRQEGLNVEFGNIFYVSRDDFKMKECVIIWDAEAEHDVEEFLKLTREAREAIARGELPQASVDPQSAKYLCGNICSFRSQCDSAQEKLAEAEKRVRKRKPQWVYKKAAQDREELRRKMIELGVVQPFLPGLY